MHAYQEAIAATAAPRAPWFVVAEDRKWFARLVVEAAINEAPRELDLNPPLVLEAEKTRLAGAQAKLEAKTQQYRNFPLPGFRGDAGIKYRFRYNLPCTEKAEVRTFHFTLWVVLFWNQAI